MPATAARWHKARMLDPFAPDPDALTDRELEQARWHPERETLLLAAAGAAKVLGPDHSATRAFAKAAATTAGPEGDGSVARPAGGRVSTSRSSPTSRKGAD